MPTEVEWEFAARGASSRAYPWGDDAPKCNRSCFDRNGQCVEASEGVSTCNAGGRPLDRTPEGVFYIPRVLPNSMYYKAFLLSYPDAADAQRGLMAGLITQAEHDAIVAAQAARTEPPQETGLGGLIEIHGMGGSSDWTWGCIAADNTVIDTLWPVLAVGDNIVVRP